MHEVKLSDKTITLSPLRLDTLAGAIDLRFTQTRLAPGQVNIAYGLYPLWRGLGLATRAVHLTCEYAATEGATEAVIQVDLQNPTSAAVALRAGFTHQARITTANATQLDHYVRSTR